MIPLIWYGPDPARGPEAVWELRRERVRLVLRPPTGASGGYEDRQVHPLLAFPSCCVKVFTLGAGGVPTRAAVRAQELDAVALDPATEWHPRPVGPEAKLPALPRPPGTRSWHCLLAASQLGDRPLLVRVRWSGDSLTSALRELETHAWQRLSHRFVCAALGASRLGRRCMGAEGPALAALAPWQGNPPAACPPAMTGRQVDEAARALLSGLLRGKYFPLPDRGTDAFRIVCELGRLARERQTALALAGAHAEADEVPAALVHAVSLHAALRGVREVEVSGVRVRAEDLQGAVELWAQWGE